MNNRRKLVIALGAGALAASIPSLAQQQGKVWRIGFLAQTSGKTEYIEAFLEELRGLGYVEGSNLLIAFSRAPNPPTCRSSSRPSWNSS